MTEAQLEPSAVYAIYDGAGYACCVRFEGFPNGVEAQRAALLALAKCAPDAAHSLAAEHDAARTHGALQIKITAPASLLGELHEHAVAPLFASLGEARAVVYPVVGVGFVGGEVGDAAAVVRVLQTARTWAESVGGTLVTGEAPGAIRSAFDAWGTPPPGFGLMRALKDRFDPQHRLNPGGFVGGL
jgi:glycolate oxidase FAD binding subunit